MPGADGLDLLKKVSLAHPDIAVVMLTPYGTSDSAIEATRLGAVDYVTKPFRVEELRLRLEHVFHTVELKREAINTARRLRRHPKKVPISQIAPHSRHV